MELSAQETVLFGLILPPLLSVLIRPEWSARLQSIVSLAGAFAATLVVNGYEHHELSLDGLPSLVLTAFVAHKAFYEPVGLADIIESKTLPAKKRFVKLAITEEYENLLRHGLKVAAVRIVNVDGVDTLNLFTEADLGVVPQEAPSEEEALAEDPPTEPVEEQVYGTDDMGLPR